MDAPRDTRHAATERGSAAVPIVLALPVMLGMMALALDLSYMYVRQSQLQQVADGIALAAARELNGTSDGLDNANDQAYFVAKDSMWGFGKSFAWNPAALTVARGANGPWEDMATAASDPNLAGLVFVKADTSKLSGIKGKPGTLETLLAGILGAGPSRLMAAEAVAGPTSVEVTPLAICALDPLNPTGVRNNGTAPKETLEYGFRRGVSYNLLDLSPSSTTSQAYLVNPIDPATGSSLATHFNAVFVKPFFCSGTVALAKVNKLHVTALTLDIKSWLNSRFNDFVSPDHCTSSVTARPDSDIREYTGGYPNWYMNGGAPVPDATAAGIDGIGPRTIAELPINSTVAYMTANSFGPLWVYSKPVASDGVSTITTSHWNQLYKVNGVSPSNYGNRYPSSPDVPYMNTEHWFNNLDTGVRDRRVLNIPLLDCPGGAPATPAKVLAVGRFFMTSKATSGGVPGEFAGLMPSGIPISSVALYK